MAYVIDDSQKSPNILLNGDMAVAQRGSSLAITGTGNGYIVDRWLGYETVVNGTYSQQALSGQPGFAFCTRVQRNNGNAGIGVMSLAQNMETKEARKYAGRVVTFSFLARAGANFSAASSALTVQFLSGSGTDESVRTGYTGSVTVLNTSVVLTTTLQQFVFSFLIPATATEFAPVFSFTTVGTAGAADYFEVTGVMLTEGGLQPYRGAGSHFEDEFAMCQRYTLLAGVGMFGAVLAANTSIEFQIIFPVTMRAAPTASLLPGTISALNYPAGGQAQQTAASPTLSQGVTGTQFTGYARLQIGGFGAMTTGDPAVLQSDKIIFDAEIY